MEKEINYKINDISECKREVEIEMPWEEVDGYLKKCYKDIAKEVSMPGFRKGKVPLRIVKERFKSEAKGHFLNNYIPDILTDVFTKEEINPANTPNITDFKLEEGSPFHLTTEVEVMPDIQVKKYKKLKLKKPVYEVSEKDIEETIENLREKNSTLKSRDGVAGNGDHVFVDLRVFMGDEEINLNNPRLSYFEIGGENVLPGFDKNIIGMKKNEEKEVKYKFPENYENREIAGKEAVCKLTVKEVKEKSVPSKKEIAQSMGFENERKLRKHIKENMKKRLDGNAKNELENKIVEQLLSKNEFGVPEGLVEEKTEENLQRGKAYIQQQGGDPSEIDVESMKKKTVREIRAGLILSKIAQQEGIEVKDEDREKEKKRMMEMFGTNDPDKVKNFVNENSILTNKVFEFIKRHAKIKEVKVEEELKKN